VLVNDKMKEQIGLELRSVISQRKSKNICIRITRL
jgi:hypothetical protein